MVAAILAQVLSHLHQRLCYSGKREAPRRERPEPVRVGSEAGASLEGGGSHEAPPVSSLLSCGLGWSPDICDYFFLVEGFPCMLKASS